LLVCSRNSKAAASKQSWSKCLCNMQGAYCCSDYRHRKSTQLPTKMMHIPEQATVIIRCVCCMISGTNPATHPPVASAVSSRCGRSACSCCSSAADISAGTVLRRPDAPASRCSTASTCSSSSSYIWIAMVVQRCTYFLPFWHLHQHERCE
jgi:hypothetical protein